MPKNIVICCDGTGNEFGNENSNVVKLYSTLVINETQIGYYHPGVGTMGSPAARNNWEKQWDRIKGMAFGYGLSSNISDAYRYLMDTYADGDRVFIFGFSRGAYTARALAGVLHMYGLLCPGNEGLIPYVVRMFSACSRQAGGLSPTFVVAHNFKNTFSRFCSLHFLGLWDTVSSVGWVYDPVVLPYSTRNPEVKTVRHAISLHERRCNFQPNLWGQPFDQQQVKQVWFTGVHSDIGGSYSEQTSQLSKVTLEWMLVEARGFDLLIDPDRANMVLGRQASPERWMPQYVQPDPKADMHNSLVGWWKPMEYLPHRYVDQRSGKPVARYSIPKGRFRQIPEGATIYAPAAQRLRDTEPHRLPKQYFEEPPARFPETFTPGVVNAALRPSTQELLTPEPQK